MADSEDLEVKTNDMGLATYLNLKGFKYRAHWSDNTHWWVFEAAPGITGWYDKWLGYEATVEPREYNRVFGKLKKELVLSRPE